MSSLKLPPGPSPRDFMGPIRGLRTRPLEYLLEIARDYGDFSYFKLGKFHSYLVLDPRALKHILCDTSGNYTKENPHWDQLRLFAGRGIFTNDGPIWKKHRRIAQPSFQRDGIEVYSSVMIKRARELLGILEKQSQSGEIVDISKETSRVALKTVGETLLNLDLSHEAESFEDLLKTLLSEAEHRITSPFPLPLWIPTSRNLKVRRATQTLDQIIFKLIQERKQTQSAPHDLLNAYMTTPDEETGKVMSDQQLRDELVTIILAGHETTAIILTFTIYLLAKFPETLRRIRDELRETLDGRDPKFEDISNLKFMKRVVQEVIRLYPPVWNITRTPGEDDRVLGYDVPKGSLMFISPYVLNHHPSFWKNPEGFDPERWVPGGEGEKNRHIYIPFGLGQRMCLGQSFALTEIQIILAMVLQKYEFELVPGYSEKIQPSLSLRPQNGIHVRVKSLRSEVKHGTHQQLYNPPIAERHPSGP
jgi:cytochrome P450